MSAARTPPMGLGCLNSEPGTRNLLPEALVLEISSRAYFSGNAIGHTACRKQNVFEKPMFFRLIPIRARLNPVPTGDPAENHHEEDWDDEPGDACEYPQGEV